MSQDMYRCNYKYTKNSIIPSRISKTYVSLKSYFYYLLERKSLTGTELFSTGVGLLVCVSLTSGLKRFLLRRDVHVFFSLHLSLLSRHPFFSRSSQTPPVVVSIGTDPVT